ncbi:GntR family transcriptional regulator [Puniceibacterium confluentis]|uniref:GntR family transcriptional regulator n=1 Tax=Puniceibacterium confluentis TaxID=1958944 RepID=UPI0011B54D81|nr:GntR family transcriptional regulator [Puniceibacterium confluentis]
MTQGLSSAQASNKEASLTDLLTGVTLNPEAGGGIAFLVFDLLLDLIVSVQLRPGQRISDKEIASALGISKTPVREALIRLDEANLVKLVPQSGTYVTLISVQRYTTACFIRLQLEMGAARAAAAFPDPRHSVAELEDLHAQLIAVQAADDHIGFVRIDEAFHQRIFMLAGYGDAWVTARRTQFDLNRARNIRRRHRILRGPEVLEQHAEVIAALQARDPDRAEAAMRVHIGDIDRQISRLFTDYRLNGLIELPTVN